MCGYKHTKKNIKSDTAQRKIAALQHIIPEVFDKDKIDWEKLKVTLGEYIGGNNERYVLNWAGKRDAFKAIQNPSTRTLVPIREESLHFDTTKNIFIEGENLEVLKVLQKSYYQKVKMIYIDPPYNTGHDVIYADTFTERKSEYQQRVGDRDKDGTIIRQGGLYKNSKEHGQYHSKWLSMMYSRLFLARDLLRDDGVIFVSIDDNEMHNLRLLMDEIFGEENFIANLVWNTKKGAQGMTTKNMIVSNHEYILVYSKQVDRFTFFGITRDETGFANPDKDPRGPWKRQYLQRFGQGLPTRTVIDPITKQSYSFETPYTQEKLERWIQEGRILFSKHRSGYPARKEFLHEYEHKKQLVTSMGLFATKATTETLYRLFDGIKIFTNPKPDSLIAFLIEVSSNKNDLILDFFAGSGTTAHALMNVNKKDGGNRTYICVQSSEPCNENSEAYKAGYHTIADITKARIHRVSKEIEREDKYRCSTKGTRTTGEYIPTLDTGLKIMKLAESNFTPWNPLFSNDDNPKALEIQLEQSIHSVAHHATVENMVYELLLKNGKSLSSTIEHKHQCYYINNTELVLILEPITQDIIDHIIHYRPQQAIALDYLFEGNDPLKTNTVLQMHNAGITFKTI